jgi:hypothetical protein
LGACGELGERVPPNDKRLPRRIPRIRRMHPRPRRSLPQPLLLSRSGEGRLRRRAWKEWRLQGIPLSGTGREARPRHWRDGASKPARSAPQAGETTAPGRAGQGDRVPGESVARRRPPGRRRGASRAAPPPRPVVAPPSASDMGAWRAGVNEQCRTLSPVLCHPNSDEDSQILPVRFFKRRSLKF